MKKIRLIILLLIFALLSTGILYDEFAVHSPDMINASGGQLDIDITDVTIGIVSDFVEMDRDLIQIKNDNKTMEIGVQNLYAGSEANVSIRITNTGVLPLRLVHVRQNIRNITDTKTNSLVHEEALQDLVVIYDLYNEEDETGKVILFSDTVVALEQSTNVLEGNKLFLKSGESINLSLRITVKETTYGDIENKLFFFSITPFFTQAY